ncbi:MAG: hypothetical protein M5T61_02925 [Acidimicrobiia bacterium]|nr:hypothetical protein [Acidimicrobiia bacterium]
MTQPDPTEELEGAGDGAERREDQLDRAVASLRVAGTHGPETRALVAGGVLMLAGVGFVIAGWWGVSGTLDVGRQMPYLVSGGLAGIALAVIGATLYLRFSLARYLRYWLIRLVHEQRDQNERTLEEQSRQGDRIVEALARLEELLTDGPHEKPGT